MQLFELGEPVGGEQLPGLPITLTPEPRILFGFSPTGEEFSIPLGASLAKAAKRGVELNPETRLLAADLVLHHTSQEPMFIREKDWDQRTNTNRAALVHLYTGVGEGGVLTLTGPTGAPVVIPGERPEVRRPWLPFSEAAGVKVISDHITEVDENGVVRWKEECDKPPFLVLTMLRGATFRVMRSGEIEDAPKEFTVHWNGSGLITTIMQRKQPYDQRRPRQVAKREQLRPADAVS